MPASSGVFTYNPGSTTISGDTAGAIFVRFGLAYNGLGSGGEAASALAGPEIPTPETPR